MPKWTSYEPVGKGYRLFDDQGKDALIAPTPALDAILPSLKPRADYLAQGGAGGTSGDPEPSQVPPRPAPVASDAAPIMSGGGEPVSREPPAQPAATSSDGGAGQPPAGRQRARVAPAEGQQPQQPADPGAAFDPAQIPSSPMSASERELQLTEDAWVKRQSQGSPIVRTPAHWQDKQRRTEGKVIDPAAVAEWEAAQKAAQESAGQLARSKAEAEAKALELQKGAADKENEIEARKGAAARKAQEEQLKIEADLEDQRKALENPSRDFWKGSGTAEQVAAAIAVGLSNWSDAVRGGKGDAGSQALQQAIDRHIADRERQVTLLERQRGRGKEAAAETQARLEAERVTALRQIDDQIKQTLTAGQNPVLRELVMEDVPPSEAKKAAAVAIVRGMRKMIPGANMDEADIKKSADEYIATMTPQEKRAVFDFGPNGELIPRENVTFVAEQHAKNVARLDAARERLNLADKLGQVQSLAQEWEKEKVTGGGGDPLKLRMQILKDRIKRGADVREMDLKSASITGSVAAARSKVQTEAAEKAEQRAEKSGARTVVYGGQEYETRPGTSEKEMQDVRDSGASLVTIDKALAILEKEASLKNKFVDNPRVAMASKMLAGISAGALLNSGVVNPSELESFNKTAGTLGALGPSGLQALQDIRDVTKARMGARLEQMGAKPRGTR